MFTFDNFFFSISIKINTDKGSTSTVLDNLKAQHFYLLEWNLEELKRHVSVPIEKSTVEATPEI